MEGGKASGDGEVGAWGGRLSKRALPLPLVTWYVCVCACVRVGGAHV